jgi:hypothetical protein
VVTDLSKTIPLLKGRGAASPLAGLLRLLARQAVREVKTRPAVSPRLLFAECFANLIFYQALS